MAFMDLTGGVPRAKLSERREMQLMMLAAYPFCLGAAVLSRLGRREGPESGPRRSVFAEAKGAASAAIPFVFR